LHNHPESELQIAIVRYLRQSNIPVFSVPNEAAGRVNSKRGLSRISRLKAMGMTPGAPDLVVFYNGRVVFLELKAPRGRLSEHQKEMQRLCREHGIGYYVIRSIDDLLEAIT